MSPLRRRILLISIAAVVAVLLLAAGLLYLETSTPLAKVTVLGGEVTIEQGTIGGHGVVGAIGSSPQSFGGTDEGYPVTLGPGGTFTIGVALANRDNVSHTLDAVRAIAPFGISNTSVALPFTLPPGQDFVLQVALTAPTSAGSYDFDVTLVSFH